MGHHHYILWQDIPQTNYKLGKEIKLGLLGLFCGLLRTAHEMLSPGLTAAGYRTSFGEYRLVVVVAWGSIGGGTGQGAGQAWGSSGAGLGREVGLGRGC